MNRLVIIGNGFDLAHGLKTSYMDFIDWYWDQRVLSFVNNPTRVSEDCLCRITIKEDSELSSWSHFIYINSNFKDIYGNRKYSGSEIIKEIRDTPKDFTFECCPLFSSMLDSIDTKGWVDIENDYYRCLKKAMFDPLCGYTFGEINRQLAFLQNKLVEYLRTQKTENIKKELLDAIANVWDIRDISFEGKKKAIDSVDIPRYKIESNLYNEEDRKKMYPSKIMLLNFNYTDTAAQYDLPNLTHNYIHGELSKEKEIIFGYGDELDKDYKELLDMNDNELLKYAKNVKYLETSHYRKMLNFINAGPFLVFIMGHSCGNSDRTLLNTVFEHENCVSIKPFYYKKSDETDNYLELVQNISRNFTDMKLFRDRVVNKEQCLTM